MEPASSDYMSLSDLSKPRLTPLQAQLEKIDPSIIAHGAPSTRSQRRGYARQRTGQDFSSFEITLLAFREIILNRLWKQHERRFQNEVDFCKFQWGILKPRKAVLIECAELLIELSTVRIRPCSEQVCTALVQASLRLQHSALQRTSIAPDLWKRVLEAWRSQYDIKSNEPVQVESMAADFVNSVLLPQSLLPSPSPSATQSLAPAPNIGNQGPLPASLQEPVNVPSQPHQRTLSSPRVLYNPDLHLRQHRGLALDSAISTLINPQMQHIPLIHVQPPSQLAATTERLTLNAPVGPLSSGANSSSTQFTAPPGTPSSPATPTTQPEEPFRKRVAHLLTDERRFHAPTLVLERVHQFFKGSPQLDPTAFEGSTVEAMISVPFPEIMDTECWRTPVADHSGQANATFGSVPIQSCFMHVPILPSKRRYETDTEVILLDDVRLAGQLNAKLWEEFANGNVVEAISIVPTSATWFGKTELADWPCVVMTGLKFEEANATDPSGKKCSEVHSYIAVYLGRDPLRQAQFVQTFQDLGISPAQSPECLLATGGTQLAHRNAGHHRWIAGFRRLFRTTPGGAPSSAANAGGFKGGVVDRLGSAGGQGQEQWHPSDDDEDTIDPQFDDIYSILPPNKKPRLERIGRPSDSRAAWHHSKRRKMEGDEFSKLKDPDLNGRQWDSDDDMSE